MEIITSRDNKYIKELAGLLTSKKKRDDSGLFVLEGARLCKDAFQSGIVFDTLFLTEDAQMHYPDLKGIAAGKTLFISRELAQRVGDTKHPQGVFAVCRKREADEAACIAAPDKKYLLLCGLQDPGNLGTILRTAQALGISAVYVVDCPDPYAPKVLRAAMGGSFRIPIISFQTGAAAVRCLQAAGVPVYAAALTENAAPVQQVNLAGGCGVLIGNEGAGLPAELIEQCDGSVVIPMKGNAESLNAAIAAALLIWEMTK